MTRNARVRELGRHRRPALAASAILLGVGLAGSTPAAARSNDLQISGAPTSQGSFTSTPDSPLFDFTEISPGIAHTKLIAVRNAGNSVAAPGTLRVAATDITGALGRELQITIARTPDPTNGAVGPVTTVYTGTVDSLSSAVIVVPDLRAGQVDGLEFTATLPESAGNRWQNTAVSFDLVLTLSEMASGTGTAAESSSVGLSATPTTGRPILGTRSGELPFTGGAIRPPLLAAGGLMLLGSALALLARYRRTASTGCPPGGTSV